ncbi:MAG: ArsA family ATPase [Polyangiaceae bacterium]|jgi:anion-transporting  ArsA/GET3 family ATPase
MSTLADKRFVLVTGKGGVGKTTVCAALAVACAARGKRVLVAMCNSKEALSGMLGSEAIGAEVVRAADNVWAVNMNPERALEEYGTLVLHSRTLYRTLFDNRYVRAFLRAIPGMQSWSMLGKAWWHTTERRTDGSPRFDVVILDAPATGHGLDMVRVPRTILDVAPPGILRRDAERAWSLLTDPTATLVALVTLPEDMPISETIELAHGLDDIGLPVGRVVVNRLLSPLFSADERRALETLNLPHADGAADAVLMSARSRAIREKLQDDNLKRLARELPKPTFYLPHVMRDTTHLEAIRQLASRLT